jgi:hypothetical protein
LKANTGFDMLPLDAKGLTMSLKVENIKLVHRVVGTKHVFTSPDVPQLHVSHADRQTAFNAIQSALDMFARMEERASAKRAMDRMKRESVAA